VTLGPDEADTLIRAPSATKAVVPRSEETAENRLAQVVTEVMNRSIGAQEQMAQAMRTQSYQMARLIGTVSTNSQPILVTNTPTSASAFSTHRMAPRIVPVTTSSGESSGSSSSGPSSPSGPASSRITELRPTGPRNSGNLQAPPPRADRQGRNVSFQPHDFVSIYRNTSGRHCFRCGSADHIATKCLPGTAELPVQEQWRLRQEWLRRTGRAAPVAHAAISEEEESDVESVDADSHIPGWETRRTPCARTARPEDTIYDSESDGLCPKQRDWRWAFKLSYDTEPLPQTERMTGYVPQGQLWPPECPTRMDDSSPKRPIAARQPDYRSGAASLPTFQKTRWNS